MHRRNLGLTSAALLVAGSAAAQAQPTESTLDAVRRRGTLIVGVRTDYPPYGYIDAAGAMTGFDIELAKYVARSMEVRLEMRPVTSANRIPMLQSGNVDLLAASLSVTRRRAEAVDFSIPYTAIQGRFVVKRGSGIKGYEELAGRQIAVLQGTPSIVVIRARQPRATLVTFQDKPQAVLAVLQGRAAAFVDDAGPAQFFVRQHPELEAVGEPFEPQVLALGLRPNDAKFRNAVNFAILDMSADGSHLRAYRQFFEAEPDAAFRIWPWPQ